VRVAVDDPQSLGCRVLGHELGVLPAERFAESRWCMATKVGQPFTFLFAHVVVIGISGPIDGRPPFIGTDHGGVGVSHSVANVVVVTDRIQCFTLGIVDPPLQQLRVEDLLLDVGVDVQPLAEWTPNPLQRRTCR